VSHAGNAVRRCDASSRAPCYQVAAPGGQGEAARASGTAVARARHRSLEVWPTAGRASPQARRRSAKWLLSVGRASTRACGCRYQRRTPRLIAPAATSAPPATGWGRCTPRTRARARMRARPAHPSTAPRPWTSRRVAPWLGQAKAGAWHARRRRRGKTPGIQANTWWAMQGVFVLKPLSGCWTCMGWGPTRPSMPQPAQPR
jgi:hypothetical protein